MWNHRCHTYSHGGHLVKPPMPHLWQDLYLWQKTAARVMTHVLDNRVTNCAQVCVAPRLGGVEYEKRACRAGCVLRSPPVSLIP
eukprot:358530-Chlamydomonas_euryale.AAC.2